MEKSAKEGIPLYPIIRHQVRTAVLIVTVMSGSSTSFQNQQHGKAVLVGNKGRVVKIQYSTSASSPTHGHGEGYDNKGNTYTLVY